MRSPNRPLRVVVAVVVVDMICSFEKSRLVVIPTPRFLISCTTEEILYLELEAGMSISERPQKG